MNKTLNQAQHIIQDDFDTQYKDIKNEIDQYVSYNPNVFKNKTILLPCDDPINSPFVTYFIDNFDKLGLKKIISTRLTSSNREKSKIFIIECHCYNNKCIKDWLYLNEDDDCYNEELQKICHDTDIIVTNSPFSLFKKITRNNSEIKTI